MRCAIYARFSSDLQRESSIEDQIRQCRAFAAQKGWIVLDEFVRFDQALSGDSLPSRNALLSLVEDAKKEPRPYDRLLIDDTSRLARNIEDALRLTNILRFHNVAVTAVSQGIHSEEKSARSLLALHGIIDEQYLAGVAEKVHRGQEGRVLKGLHPGGRCYGYRNVPIEDPTRPAKYGRPAVSGVRLEINQQEASVIQRIYHEYAEGFSLAALAKRLNADGVLSPQPSQAGRQRSWGVSSLYEMLRNDRYRGVHVWNRTRKERDPETGRKVSRPRPPSEWQRVAVPEWRIVSDEVWQAVHSRAKLMRDRFGSSGRSGIRSAAWSKYLFSGLLVCGECGAHITIVAGNGKRAYPKYGCPNHSTVGHAATA